MKKTKKNIYGSRYARLCELEDSQLNIWKKTRNRLLKRLLNPLKEDLILEVGCDTGSFCNELSKKCDNLYGIDINKEAIRIARGRYKHIKFFDTTAEHFSFPENFSKIYSIQTLEHIPDYRTTLKSIYALLKKEGIFYLSVPAERIRGDRALDDLIVFGKNTHLNKFRVLPLKKSLEKTGFNIKKIYLSSLFFPHTNINITNIRNNFLISLLTFISADITMVATK